MKNLIKKVIKDSKEELQSLKDYDEGKKDIKPFSCPINTDEDISTDNSSDTNVPSVLPVEYSTLSSV